RGNCDARPGHISVAERLVRPAARPLVIQAGGEPWTTAHVGKMVVGCPVAGGGRPRARLKDLEDQEFGPRRPATEPWPVCCPTEFPPGAESGSRGPTEAYHARALL